MERLAHLFHACLVACICGFGSFLRNSGGASNHLSLKAFDCGNELWVVACQPTDTITRHSKCLAHTVDEDKAILQLGELSQCLMLACVENMLVNLISQHNYLWVALEYFYQCFQVFECIYRTCWVVWRAEHQ